MWLSGFLNAGTPLETASTPDRATAPEENARNSTITPTAVVASACSIASLLTFAGSIAPMFFRMKTRTRPTVMSVTSMTT